MSEGCCDTFVVQVIDDVILIAPEPDDIIVLQEGGGGTPGPVGPQGPAGPMGPQGVVGPQGPQGLRGEAGPAGAQGQDGAQGPAGERGAIGATGPAGADGAQGERGPIGLTGPQGPQGEKGDTGSQGLQGIQGPQGERGLQGDAGPEGSAGPKGDDGDTGPQGLQGPQGIQGERGATGLQGPAGADGADGDIGPQGPQGEKGDTGEAGPQGPKGDTGDTGDILNAATNLSVTRSSSSVTVNSSTGTPAVLPAATSALSGVLTDAMYTRLMTNAAMRSEANTFTALANFTGGFQIGGRGWTEGEGTSGRWMRFPNGWQICAWRRTGIESASVSSGSVHVIAASGAWTYPAAFSENPIFVDVATLSIDGRFFDAKAAGIGATGVVALYITNISSGTAPSPEALSFFAVGRWY